MFSRTVVLAHRFRRESRVDTMDGRIYWVQSWAGFAKLILIAGIDPFEPSIFEVLVVVLFEAFGAEARKIEVAVGNNSVFVDVVREPFELKLPARLGEKPKLRYCR